MTMKALKRKLTLTVLTVCASAMLQAQTLTIVHTGDTHSCVEPLPKNFADEAQAGKGGYVRRATLLRQLREQSPDLLLFDTGDFSQGSEYYTLFKGETEVALMNEMGYDVVAFGNHEFDSGLENLARLIRMAQFPFVSCNLDFTGTPCEGLVKQYVLLERAGMRIGVTGVCVKLDGLVSKSNYGNTRWSDPAEAAQRVVDILRGEEHCDVVVCLSHLGYSADSPSCDPAFIAGTRGIDVVLGGHSHTYWEYAHYFPNADGRMIPLDHQGKNGQYVGVLRLEY